jgi:hypothetical protein
MPPADSDRSTRARTGVKAALPGGRKAGTPFIGRDSGSVPGIRALQQSGQLR